MAMNSLQVKKFFSFLKNTLSIFALSSSAVFAHGEDKLGPHGGFIRMPGAFHTEVVPKEKELYIYVLDVHWKNPTTKDAFVEATLKTKLKETPLTCQPDKNFFRCDLSKDTSLKTGQLIVVASRDTYPKGTASYDLPLKLVIYKDHHGKH